MSSSESSAQDRPARSELQRADAPGPRGAPAAMPDPESASRSEGFVDVSAVHDVAVRISVVLGTAEIPVRQLLKLGRGAVLELNRKIGDQVDVLVNDRLVARGEIVSLGERLGVTMTELCRSDIAS